MNTRTTTALITILLGACANQATVGKAVEKTISAAWDPSHASQLMQPGNNTLKGNAFMRQVGGGVVTCAGQTVSLVPATPYASERFAFLYPEKEGGLGNNVNAKFSPDYPEYQAMRYTTKCDAQGNFAFESVADGEFFAQVSISWKAGVALQGGNLMQRVRLAGGKTQSIVVAP
jgi:hypothetical protein